MYDHGIFHFGCTIYRHTANRYSASMVVVMISFCDFIPARFSFLINFTFYEDIISFILVNNNMSH